MTGEEILKLADSIKLEYNTNDPIELCKKMGIGISITGLNPRIYPAYILHVNEKPSIILNKHFTENSQKILCAHELGHALIHGKRIMNQFKDTTCPEHVEYEANLFAVALIFNRADFKLNLLSMNNYLLEGILDHNLELDDEI